MRWCQHKLASWNLPALMWQRSMSVSRLSGVVQGCHMMDLWRLPALCTRSMWAMLRLAVTRSYLHDGLVLGAQGLDLAR